MKLVVELGASSEAPFVIQLNDTAFVRKWLEEFRWCLLNCQFNQDEVFAGFLTLHEAAEKLNSACVIINKYLKNFIELRSDLLNQSQEYFNYLHQKFEQLSGEFGKPTRLFRIANNELKSAIRNLNFYIHVIENKKISNNFYISFDKNTYRRQPLTSEDYVNFNFQTPAGSLILHYVELGKTFYDLYKDNLDLSYSGQKNLHFYSGEASLVFDEIDYRRDSGYFKWLEKNNIDPYDKTLGHGIICLGHVVDLSHTYSTILSNKHLNKIQIKE